MKNSIAAFISSAMLAVTVMPATTSMAQAKSAAYSVNTLQGEGFRKCKALGNTGYTAIVRGTSLNEDSLFNDNGFGKFYVRSCFVTMAECRNYVSTFENRLIAVNTIDHRSCKRRG